jgi:NAD dependent epimerase/dehydratase
MLASSFQGMETAFESARVLVTGAGGFIGSHLCQALLERGAEVTAMLRYSSSASWGNLRYLPAELQGRLVVTLGNVEDPDYVQREVEGQDYIFHLAALIGIPYSYVAPRSYIRTNVEGTLNILEAARRWKTPRVVHTSTSETYGTAMYAPIDESHPLQGQSPYSASKIGADKLVESYHRSFELPVATIRPFNTYGPRQSARAVIPTIISQALTQPNVKLGALAPIRDLTFVQDTVRGFLRIALSDAAVGQVVNIGSGKGISIGDLARRILGLMQLEKEVETDTARKRPDKSEVHKLLCANDKAEQLLGWEPQHSLDEGLRHTIEFVENHIDHFHPDRYSI